MAANKQAQRAGTDGQNKVMLVGSGFVAGLIVGMVIMNFMGSSDGGGQGSGAPAPITGGQQQGPNRIQLTSEIAQAEEIVKKDPGNYAAWVTIGNDYFDLGEPQKSVNAYGKALAIKDGDPNVITDMGIMYQRLKDTPKAVAAFRKAMAISPTHPQSRYQLGMVLMHDMNDKAGAIAAWEDFLRVAPNFPESESVRQMVGELKGSSAGPSGGVDLDKAARDLAAKSNSPAPK